MDETDLAKRDEALGALRREVADENDDDDSAAPPSSSKCYRSWVRGEVAVVARPRGDRDPPPSSSSSSSYPTDRCRFFDRHGFVFLPGFADGDEVRSMKESMADLVEREWKPSSRPTEVFRTDGGQIDAQGRSDYFLDSASRCHFFAEKDAIRGNGELKEEYETNKLAALNKAGHGMHAAPGPFRTYTKSAKVSKLLRELGWTDPVAPQSMYIFKQARIGGEVTSHQDSTFLHTTPRQTCIGLWLALDDATMENGCLWIRPGSHREAVRRQFVRNPEHFGESLDYDGEGGDADRTKPQMIFRKLCDDGEHHVAWDGALPKDSLPAPECAGLHRAGFIPVPCGAGDLLAFAGELDHLSLPNFSSEPRHTFQLHCVEGEGAGVTWSRENWLQYPEGVPFVKL